MKYEALTFTIPELDGISRESIELHLGLYAGYVKHVNLIRDRLDAYSNDPEANSYAMAEMQRRLGFEFGGMRNHEYYVAQFEGGAKALPEGSLKDKIVDLGRLRCVADSLHEYCDDTRGRLGDVIS